MYMYMYVYMYMYMYMYILHIYVCMYVCVCVCVCVSVCVCVCVRITNQRGNMRQGRVAHGAMGRGVGGFRTRVTLERCKTGLKRHH